MTRSYLGSLKLRASDGSKRRLALIVAVGSTAVAGAAILVWHGVRERTARSTLQAMSHERASADAAVPGARADVDTAPAGTGATAPHMPAGVDSTVVVGRNDTLDAIFRRMALDNRDLAAIRNLPGVRQTLDLLKPGDVIEVTRSESGQLQRLSRKVSETRTLDVIRNGPDFAATLTDAPVQTRLRTARATIDSSLFQAAGSARISDTVALKLADVFAWDIDFVLDIRRGDRFTVTYEQVYRDGRFVRDGEILAAQFVNAGRTYRAVRYAAEGGVSGYYTPDGRPLKKPFLRAPVQFTRVSSVFATNRMHPILNRIRGHMGTDYAAPTGTPVHAAGDGRICFEGTRGGYGNAVVLSHNNGISTLYGHLSRFARNVRLGARVAQGEVIGYVGMTGLATGPHLHYEYLTNGVHMNPQTVKLPGAEPLRADALDRFRSASAPLLGSLAAPAPEAEAASPVAAATASPGAAATASSAMVTAADIAAAPGSSPSRRSRSDIAAD